MWGQGLKKQSEFEIQCITTDTWQTHDVHLYGGSSSAMSPNLPLSLPKHQVASLGPCCASKKRERSNDIQWVASLNKDRQIDSNLEFLVAAFPRLPSSSVPLRQNPSVGKLPQHPPVPPRRQEGLLTQQLLHSLQALGHIPAGARKGLLMQRICRWTWGHKLENKTHND